MWTERVLIINQQLGSLIVACNFDYVFAKYQFHKERLRFQRANHYYYDVSPSTSE